MAAPKKLKVTGEIIVNTPRDRDGSFRPLLIKKGQTRFCRWMSKFSVSMRGYEHMRYCGRLSGDVRR